MQIIITPNDIIERCLWDKYKKFVLFNKTEHDIKMMVDENLAIPISEEDAYAIGLLKIIETDNLIHRFNENMLDTLQIKSNIINDELFINKNSILKEINSYLNKFPEYFKPKFNYKKAIEELKEYISKIEAKVSSLEERPVKQKEKIFIYLNSKDIRKCLDLN
jgi:hypothetical protein